MSSTPPLLRGLWAVVALTQFVVAAGGPLADAALEEVVEAGVTHVESQAGEQCPSQHDHLFCQLCRTLTVAWTAPPPTRLQAPRITHGTRVDLDGGEHSLRPAGHFPPLGSRAPPLG